MKMPCLGCSQCNGNIVVVEWHIERSGRFGAGTKREHGDSNCLRDGSLCVIGSVKLGGATLAVKCQLDG